jgi:hypothetical protein
MLELPYGAAVNTHHMALTAKIECSSYPDWMSGIDEQI